MSFAAQTPRRRRLGFWAVAYAFVVLFAFSTAPSPLYVLYAARDGFSSLMITLIYAAYAVGVMASLFFAAHLSDVHGRRPHLLGAIALALSSAGVFIGWPTVFGLFLARTLCGLSVGLTVSTATAYLNESDRARRGGSPGARSDLAAPACNLGGLAAGALLAGLLAQYLPDPLTTPYGVLVALLGIAAVGVVAAPETRPRRHPRPAYRPQRISVAHHARAEFLAALTGVFFAYAGPAIFIALAGTFLATAVHDDSLAMAGAAIFIVFIVGVALMAATGSWAIRRLLVAGVALEVIGLAMVVAAAWLPSPSLALFLAGGGVIGAAAAALFKATLGRVVAIGADHLGEALAGYFLSGYVGLSLPAIAAGIALRFLDPRATLLVFAVAVSIGVLVASRRLLGQRT